MIYVLFLKKSNHFQQNQYYFDKENIFLNIFYIFFLILKLIILIVIIMCKRKGHIAINIYRAVETLLIWHSTWISPMAWTMHGSIVFSNSPSRNYELGLHAYIYARSFSSLLLVAMPACLILMANNPLN